MSDYNIADFVPPIGTLLYHYRVPDGVYTTSGYSIMRYELISPRGIKNAKEQIESIESGKYFIKWDNPDYANFVYLYGKKSRDSKRTRRE